MPAPLPRPLRRRARGLARRGLLVELEVTGTERYQNYQVIEFDRPAPRVLRLTLNRPERMNALDSRGHAELVDVWRDIDADPDVSAVVLRGAGRAFPRAAISACSRK